MSRGYSLLYKDNEVIFEEDSNSRDIYIIENGKVEISMSIDGDKVRIALLEKGEFFGEMAPITGVVRSATATAVGDTYLVPLTMEEMLERMQTDPEFMLSVLRKLMNRLRNTTSELRDLTLKMYRPDKPLMEKSPPVKTPLADVAGEAVITRESNRRLQKTVDHLEQQVQEKDKQIEEMRIQIEQSQRRNWFKRSLTTKSYHSDPPVSPS